MMAMLSRLHYCLLLASFVCLLSSCSKDEPDDVRQYRENFKAFWLNIPSGERVFNRVNAQEIDVSPYFFVSKEYLSSVLQQSEKFDGTGYYLPVDRIRLGYDIFLINSLGITVTPGNSGIRIPDMDAAFENEQWSSYQRQKQSEMDYQVRSGQYVYLQESFSSNHFHPRFQANYTDKYIQDITITASHQLFGIPAGGQLRDRFYVAELTSYKEEDSITMGGVPGSIPWYWYCPTLGDCNAPTQWVCTKDSAGVLLENDTIYGMRLDEFVSRHPRMCGFGLMMDADVPEIFYDQHFWFTVTIKYTDGSIVSAKTRNFMLAGTEEYH